MSESSRERILSRLRQGSRTPFKHRNTLDEREAAWWARQPEMGDLAEKFTAEQEKVGGKVLPVSGWDAVAEAVTPWMHEYQVRTALTGTVAELEPLRAHLAALGVRVGTFDRPVEEQKDEVFSVDCGITTAEAGIAETGSVVLKPSPHEPRLLSLAPPVHLVLLERARLFATLSHYVETGTYQAHPPTNLVLASGASRTADIELTLTVGVHGPKVFLVALIG